MRTSRTVIFSRIKDDSIAAAGTAKRDAQNRLVVPVYSAFFSSLTDNVMCTNAMFDALKKEIDASVSPYSVKERIVLTVYESSAASAPDVRESVLIGFRRYVGAYLQKKKATLKMRLITFTGLFLLGVLLEFLIYEVFPGILPLWIANTLDIIAWVFVWQFAAYMVFEFAKERKGIKRLSQILQTEYRFKHWE